MKKDIRGFSILELIIVVVIVGILAALGLSSFGSSKEQGLDKEAQANLKLIASAEKIYRMEVGTYINTASTANTNTLLRLMLPASDPNWRYVVSGATVAGFTAKSQRVGGIHPNRLWCINQAADNATNAGCGAFP